MWPRYLFFLFFRGGGGLLRIHSFYLKNRVLNKIIRFLFYMNRSTSTEDLLSMSQTVYDQLTPLSFYFYKLCLCDGEKIACSYKLFDGCTSNIGGKEYNCMLHSSSRKRRDLSSASIFQQHDNEYDALVVSLFLSICVYDYSLAIN